MQKRITVVDTSVIIYDIENRLRGYQLGPQSIEAATHHYLKLMVCGCYFPHTNIILALDTKVDGAYWRHNYLKPHGIKYKDGRKEKRKEWFTVAKAYLEAAASISIPIVGFPGYEADDVAALICQLTDNVDLYTVDTDWMQLINPRRGIRWLNTARWKPRLRDNIDAINDWGKLGNLSRATDIINVKVKEGDKSDNLPPGSPREVIDLINPPDRYNLTLQPQAVSRAERAINDALHSDFSSLESLPSIKALMDAGLQKGLFWQRA